MPKSEWGASATKNQPCGFQLVEHDPIRLNVAVAPSLPVTSQGVIAVPCFERPILAKHRYNVI